MVREEVLADFSGDRFLSGGVGEVGGARGDDGGVGEPAGFGVSGREGVESAGIVGLSKLDGPNGKLDRRGAVADSVVGMGRQQPGEVVKSLKPIGAQSQCLLIVADGASGTIAPGEKGGQLVVRFSVPGLGLNRGEVMCLGFGGLAARELEIGEIVVGFGVSRIELKGVAKVNQRFIGAAGVNQ